MARVFVGVPCYGDIVPEALDGLSAATFDHDWYRFRSKGSWLPLVFNDVLRGCLNSNVPGKDAWTHFAMYHTDIETTPGWLDLLVAEYERCGADVLSVAVSIKDGRGLLSMGVRRPNGSIRRLTMTELMRLPPTFGIEEVHELMGSDVDGAMLVVNTGLWIIRFEKLLAWCREGFCFTGSDRLFYDEDVKLWRAASMSEDWYASHWWTTHGGILKATRVVPVVHHGRCAYPNNKVWGTEETDPGDGR